MKEEGVNAEADEMRREAIASFMIEVIVLLKSSISKEE
jgi:hypothetical protein